MGPLGGPGAAFRSGARSGHAALGRTSATDEGTAAPVVGFDDQREVVAQIARLFTPPRSSPSRVRPAPPRRSPDRVGLRWRRDGGLRRPPGRPPGRAADPDPVLGLEKARRLLERGRMPAVAIGGIDEERLPELAGIGFESFALIGAVSRSDDPGKILRRLKRKWQFAKKDSASVR